MYGKYFMIFLIITLVASQLIENETTKRDHIRRPRSILGFFQTIFSVKNLNDEQYRDTTNSLQKIYTILEDSFSDTYTKKPPTLVEATTSEPNTTTSTTTEKYRISRKELGYILNRNYRGLQKLFNIEINDALNQSQYSIQDYKNEFAQAVQPFVYPQTPTNNSIN